MTAQFEIQAARYREETLRRSDKLMDYFLACYGLTGLALAFYYNTWLIAVGFGGSALVIYYSVKVLMPGSNFYQYVLSAVFGVFTAQFIYQMQGLFEMYFFAFIASAMLVTYQKWKLQIPLLVVVLIIYCVLNYLNNIGYRVYTDRAGRFVIPTYIIHVVLTTAMFFVCGLSAYQLKQYQEKLIRQTLLMAELKHEAQLSQQVHQELAQHAKELARSNAELEQFAYVASHDLQEPLRMVTGFLTQFKRKYYNVVDDNGKNYLRFALEGSQQMKQIIHDLLDYSRVGRIEDKRGQVALNEVVNDIGKLYRKEIHEQKVIIHSEDLPVIHAPKGAVRQIFQNLISNGIKYQKSGNIAKIDINIQETGSHYQFSIQDNGIGISPEYFEQIFIVFKRLNKKTEYPGTGMGLAITKKIVENLGGTIHVESEQGKGSVFYFTIPKTTGDHRGVIENSI
ncbi:ATP-binding protein [Mucilaginibacter sp. BT774]|uniref:ATP-binding protein n=1 Tax=Mucilaginibacter sp. BT774 TaxID=3062276 RepID=UPI00267525AA|nr:ATP-binding protein [Mucilaginibacter sp. BT774]MDO3625788.1 ATP-binding protein [Mucilaginibacter sp. BT774]